MSETVSIISPRDFAGDVASRLSKARAKFSDIVSLHEGYAVIFEELDELWMEVRLKSTERNPEKIYQELVDISAMAQRVAEDVLYEGES